MRIDSKDRFCYNIYYDYYGILCLCGIKLPSRTNIKCFRHGQQRFKRLFHSKRFNSVVFAMMWSLFRIERTQSCVI